MNINDIKANLQMLGSRIVLLEIKNDFVYIDLSNKNVHKELHVKHELGETERLNTGLLTCSMILDIEVDVLDDDTGDHMQVRLVQEGCFCFEEGGTEEELREMVLINGNASLYSMARGIISGITSQTCLNGAIILPMINMYEMRNRIDNESE